MNKEYQFIKDKLSELGYEIFEEQLKSIVSSVYETKEAKGGEAYHDYLNAYFDTKLYQNDDARYCPILKRKVAGIDCYETVSGCMDTNIHKCAAINTDEIYRLCMKCLFSDIS